ncbi:hypothetical protein CJ260_11350 [Megasphaera sp. ASD88]|uniref:DUF6148 family protein n=1 Tax=Megasphaera TaxID=906 RepID=UPI000BABBBFB|nr:DUF6148 family protein [Megasphaera sp. ASD88]MBM6732896.1 hypothetical protein [Megasphaera stantonii]PAV38036.1 hypothetical protein CJ260_11350 [Megasphaera sp. ASD88]
MANEALNLRLKQYLEAEKAILIAGQSYKIGNRTLSRADLSEIREAISSLIAAGATVDGSGNGGARRAMQVIMRD